MEGDKIVCFGVQPDTPSEEFGYIKHGQKLKDGYEIAQFVEKPEHSLAQDLFKTKNYFWNLSLIHISEPTRH